SAARSEDRDVVVAQAAHPGGKLPIPDDVQRTADEARLVSALLGVRLFLENGAALPGDRIVDRKAEPGGRCPGSGRVAEDVHAAETGFARQGPRLDELLAAF